MTTGALLSKAKWTCFSAAVGPVAASCGFHDDSDFSGRLWARSTRLSAASGASIEVGDGNSDGGGDANHLERRVLALLWALFLTVLTFLQFSIT